MFGMPGFTAYHSSLLINGSEYCFSDAGITVSGRPISHTHTDSAPRKNTQTILLGMYR
eukprot:UN21001